MSCACVGHPCCCGGPELAEARAAIEARIRELLPGQAVRVVFALGEAAVGDVIVERSATSPERRRIAAALPDVNWATWPREVGGGPLDELAAEQGPGRVVVLAGAEVYTCEAARFAEGRAS